MPSTYGSSSNGKPLLNGQIFNHGTTGVRHTVQSGRVDTNGYANFLGTSASLVMPISATTTPLAISASGGSLDNDRWGKVVADTTLTLSASVTSFIMATIDTVGAITFSSVTLAPIYQFGGTPSVTNNQYTFNIGEMKMYLGNGSTASQVWAVCVGEAVTSGTAVTSVVNYALNGMYDSGYTATLPNSATSKNHNIGLSDVDTSMLVKCTTIDASYAVGDIIKNPMQNWNEAAGRASIQISSSTKTISIYPAVTNPWLSIIKGATSSVVVLTSANWAYKLLAKRGW